MNHTDPITNRIIKEYTFRREESFLKNTPSSKITAERKQAYNDALTQYHEAIRTESKYKDNKEYLYYRTVYVNEDNLYKELLALVSQGNIKAAENIPIYLERLSTARKNYNDCMRAIENILNK